MPDRSRPRRLPFGRQRASGALLALVCAMTVGGCSSPTPSARGVPADLLALVADTGGIRLVGWDETGDAVPIKLPPGDTIWIATGRADVLAAVLANGKT